ncbi:unnamed protein product [Leptosia nina]|uniref:PHD-type domain-containing protein n=1 Tax=Leptosia nina TaxID=320188 RepID=A0AAV1JJT8_9NEOP
MTVCQICDKSVKLHENKLCSICASSYHYYCLKISHDNFLKESKAYKVAWKCSSCKSSDRRTAAASTPSHLSSPGPSQPSEFDLQDLKRHFDTQLQDSLAKLLADIKSDISTESAATCDRLRDLTESVNFLSSKCDKLEESLISKTKALDELKLENTSLRSEIDVLSSRLEDLDQRSRNCNIEIQCVPERKGENLHTIISQVASITGCALSEQEISNFHRVAKINSDSNRPRSIIVKLSSVLARDKLLTAVKSFNRTHKGDKLNTSHLGLAGDKKPVYVCEHLTPANKKIHAAARRIAKEKQFEFVWVQGGKIFMRKDIQSKAFIVKDLPFLNTLVYK